eukprot:CAMPEP_0174893806 /NCGR_PEP_ID=MMETSP0167-20121228/8558_1 /TAXON_ID=38298 /ORGANISM="Rhodella maculata, Strain CCMP736" /LENGTH=81 /DNA_ID=CAMNT_0016132707 /DNA_START=238 /DNA_END=480 /DNA_ORIENTATION=-
MSGGRSARTESPSPSPPLGLVPGVHLLEVVRKLGMLGRGVCAEGAAVAVELLVYHPDVLVEIAPPQRAIVALRTLQTPLAL